MERCQVSNGLVKWRKGTRVICSGIIVCIPNAFQLLTRQRIVRVKDREPRKQRLRVTTYEEGEENASVGVVTTPTEEDDDFVLAQEVAVEVTIDDDGTTKVEHRLPDGQIDFELD